MIRFVTNRLAAHTGIRQVDASLKADAAADAVDRAIGRLWRELLAHLKAARHAHGAALAQTLFATMAAEIDASLTKIAHWGHKTAVAAIKKSVPPNLLKVAAEVKVIGGKLSHFIRQPLVHEPSARHDLSVSVRSHQEQKYEGRNNWGQRDRFRRTLHSYGSLFLSERASSSQPQLTLLPVPDIRQDLAYDCGAAALRAVCAYFDIGPRFEETYMTMLGTDPEAGTRPREIIAVARELGLRPEPINGLVELLHQLAFGHPVICPMQRKRAGGHYVVVIGVEGDALIVQDPVDGRRKIGRQEWLKRWWDRDADGKEYLRYGIALARPPVRIQEDFGIADLFAPARTGLRMTDEAWQDFLDQFLFPTPTTAAQINAVVYSTGWLDRLDAATRIAGATPERLAGTISQGYALGKNVRQIAKDLLPILDGVRVSARRIARTEGLRIAARMQVQAQEEGLGDLTVGWQIHATLDERTRPKHAARNGTIYYLQPKAGQKGMDECPDPPHESPKDGYAIAWNCRCHRSAVLRNPGIVNPQGEDRAVPDPAVYSEWFDQTSERKRRIAVGTKRYSLVQDLTGEDEPGWEHFVHPKTGDLVPLKKLERESEEQRARRVARVRAAVGKNRADLARVAAFGFAA